MATKIILNEMGEGVFEGTVSRWLKQPGDGVAKYEPVLEIETDKVTTEITAEVAGILLEVLVAAGETVPVGTVLALLGDPEEVGPISSPPVPAARTTPAPNPETTLMVTGANGEARNSVVRQTPKPYTGRISPVVGRIVAEHEVDLSLVRGSGKDGRITKRDILAFVAQHPATGARPPLSTAPVPASAPAAAPVGMQQEVAVPPAPLAPPTVAGSDTIIPLTTMRRAIAEHMVRSKHTSPHVTTVFDIDFSAVAAHRTAHKAQFAQDGAKLTFTAYLVAATAAALKQFPMVNSVWGDNGVILKRDIHIGMATAIDDGLIVPVIKNADSYNLLGLARLVNDLAQRARHKQLQPADVQGGTFSITNHGVSGSLFATPIINQPQCGILGVGKIEQRVKVIANAIAIRPLAYVSLTFDHRILDGVTADHFVGAIKEQIENWA